MSIKSLLENVYIPKMYKVRQHFEDNSITCDEVRRSLEEQLGDSRFTSQIAAGRSICITAGSRGIDNYPLIIKLLVDYCKKLGAEPFIIPAMGSHAGASADGQREMLKGLGISEETMGCPVRATMETVKIGTNEFGVDVYIDRYAAESDGIIVVNRIKPHTCFRGPYESGIMKMMAIGLGKQYGASICHDAGFGSMAVNIPAFGRTILAHAPILFAVATLENSFDRTCEVVVMNHDEIEEREPIYQEKSKKIMPALLFDSADLLVVDTIGKNFSGGGLDPNVTGTFVTPYCSGGLNPQRMAILDLSEESHGNGNGAGMAHACTRRYFEKVDFEQTYPNLITSKVLENARIPCVMDNDRLAIQICLKTCTNINKENPRVLRIRNTLSLGEIWASEAYYDEIMQNDRLEIISGPEPMDFDEEGNLRDL